MAQLLELPAAAYDILSFVDALDAPLGGVTESETQLLCYLGCLLAMMEGRPASEWRYGFLRAEVGAPFAHAVADATQRLADRGLIESRDGLLRSTGRGHELLEVLTEQEELKWRAHSLRGAADSMLALRASDVRAALKAEPSLRGANIHSGASQLLGRRAVEELYGEFDALRQALDGIPTDLMIPAVVWLTFLLECEASPTGDIEVANG